MHPLPHRGWENLQISPMAFVRMLWGQHETNVRMLWGGCVFSLNQWLYGLHVTFMWLPCSLHVDEYNFIFWFAKWLTSKVGALSRYKSCKAWHTCIGKYVKIWSNSNQWLWRYELSINPNQYYFLQFCIAGGKVSSPTSMWWPLKTIKVLAWQWWCYLSRRL